MRTFAILIALIATVNAAAAMPKIVPEGPPIDVVVLGTFHFDNPGRDIANVQIDDVLAPKRQAEIAQILDELARFAPTKIMVESQRRQPGTSFNDRYPLYREGKLEPSRNEVVQLGFALAKRLKHVNVFAVDVEGEFPFENVMAFAKKSGRDARLGGQIAAIQEYTASMTSDLKTKSLGQILRGHNELAEIVGGNAFYLEMLHYGAMDEQPGATLVSAWYQRNLNICARIVQSAEPGDRVLVVYGAGHSYLLRHCLEGVPGWRLKEANDYLPK